MQNCNRLPQPTVPHPASKRRVPGAPSLDSEIWDQFPHIFPIIKSSSRNAGGIVHLLLAASILLLSTTLYAQWEIEASHTTASLRGIHNVGGGVAWASGTGGTVLRTLDDGKTWQTCPIPLAGTKGTAEKLDFRGIQGFDESTAIVMSSGPGDQSRLYKTTEGCQTWKLLFTNPDKDGFWDAVQFTSRNHGFLLGDPVSSPDAPYKHVFLEETTDGGVNWTDWHDRPTSLVLPENSSFAFFAASNSSMLAERDDVQIGFGGNLAGLLRVSRHFPAFLDNSICSPMPCKIDRTGVSAEFGPEQFASGESAGVFSIAQADSGVMLVGGDYTKPDSTYLNSLFLRRNEVLRRNEFPVVAKTPPHGYRSAVAYDAPIKTWITVGPNGTDISTDDGLNWRALTPSAQDDKDADKSWNALSLPFVVGPKGRIGKLRRNALPAVPAAKP